MELYNINLPFLARKTLKSDMWTIYYNYTYLPSVKVSVNYPNYTYV